MNQIYQLLYLFRGKSNLLGGLVGCLAWWHVGNNSNSIKNPRRYVWCDPPCTHVCEGHSRCNDVILWDSLRSVRDIQRTWKGTVRARTAATVGARTKIATMESGPYCFSCQWLMFTQRRHPLIAGDSVASTQPAIMTGWTSWTMGQY